MNNLTKLGKVGGSAKVKVNAMTTKQIPAEMHTDRCHEKGMCILLRWSYKN